MSPYNNVLLISLFALVIILVNSMTYPDRLSCLIDCWKYWESPSSSSDIYAPKEMTYGECKTMCIQTYPCM